jgi:hypothetical protein
MSIRSRLRNRFISAALAGSAAIGLAFACSGCDSGKDDRQEQRDAIQLLEQRYSDSPRIRAILEEQKSYSAEADGMKFLIDNGIRLDLSADGLPDGAVIRLFKDRWQINPLLPESTQAWAIYQAANYARGQAKDGLPYGVGESFAIVTGALSPVGTTGETARSAPSHIRSPG